MPERLQILSIRFGINRKKIRSSQHQHARASLLGAGTLVFRTFQLFPAGAGCWSVDLHARSNHDIMTFSDVFVPQTEGS